MPISDLNGVELYWERAGSGPRLLYCTGSGSTLSDARPMLDAFRGGFDVLAWDYRGFGGSGAVAGAYTMADLAADAIGLLDLVGWGSCRVFGLSFGGMVAQEIAVSHPHRVERLALACTSAGGAGGSSYPLQTLFALPAAERAATARKLVDTRWDDGWLAAHPVDRAIAQRFASGAGPEGVLAQDAHRAQLQARAGHDVWDRLGAIRCPALVACGRYDGIAPLANGRAIASRIRGADVRIYEGGHPFFLQDQTAMPAVKTFLQAEAG